MSLDPLSSSEAFIKALKGSRDPVYDNGPTKVELASKALLDSSFYIPAKKEIIADWVLSKLFKERKNDGPIPSLEPSYWRLVAAVVSSNDQPSSSKATSLWLDPLLLRFPILAIVSSVFTRVSDATEETLAECHSALRAINARSTSHPSYDSAWQLFACILKAFAASSGGDSWHSSESSRGLILECVVLCRGVLGDTANRKKTLNSFTESLMHDWVAAQICLVDVPLSAEIASEVYGLAASILFAPESLRQQIPLWLPSEPDATQGPEQSMFARLRGHLPNASSISSSFHLLPLLFQSFSHTIHTHRNTALPPDPTSSSSKSADKTSPRTRAKRLSLQYLGACFQYIEDPAPGDINSIASWSAKADLIAIVEAESLLQSDDSEAHELLLQQCQKAARAISIIQSLEDELVDEIVRFLTVAIRLDYSLVEPVLPAVLRTFAMKRNTSQVQEFLKLHLVYHVKTRKLLDVVTSLSSAINDPVSFSPESSTPSPLRPQDQFSYRAFELGCIADLSYSRELTDSLRTFLTPSQVAPSAKLLITAIEAAHDAYRRAVTTIETADNSASSTDERPKGKKRRISSKVDSASASLASDVLVGNAAARFMACMHVSRVILLALPLHFLAGDVLEELRAALGTLRKDILLPLIDSALAVSPKRKGRDRIGEKLGAAVLGFAYALQASPLWKPASGEKAEDETLLREGKKIYEVLAAKNSLPELRVILVITMLQHFSNDVSVRLFQTDAVSDFFDAVARTFSPVLPIEEQTLYTWDGLLSTLDQTDAGERAAVVAVWQIMLGRWLPVLDALAPDSFLGEVAIVALMAASDRTNELTAVTELTLPVLSRRVVRSAEFWEMPRLRRVLIAAIVGKLRTLDDLTFGKASEFGMASLTKYLAPMDEIIRTLHFVSSMPLEYLDKASRLAVPRIALVANALRLRDGRAPELETKTWDLLVLRSLIQRLALETGGLDAAIATPLLVSHLLNSLPPGPTSVSDVSRSRSYATEADGLGSVTFQLLDLMVSYAVSEANKGNSNLLKQCLQSAQQTLSAQNASIRGGLEVLLSLVSSGLKLDGADSSLLGSINDIYTSVDDQVGPSIEEIPRLLAFSQEDRAEGPMKEAVETLRSCEKMLRIENWLVMGRNAHSFQPQPILRAMVQHQSSLKSQRPWSDLCTSLLAVVIRSFVLLEGSKISRLERLDEVLAACILITSLMNVHDWDRVANLIPTLSRALSLEEYIHSPRSMQDLADRSPASDKKRRGLIARISSAMIRNAPEGTWKVNQEFITKCLGTLASIDLSTPDSSELLPLTLAVTLEIVSDKSASLRPADAGLIYAILGHALKPASSARGTPPSEFSLPLFHSSSLYESIVAVLLALVRLRRDLVSSTLPHLALMLSRLLNSLRVVRGELGTKQRKNVLDSMPTWVDPERPFGVDEARALARLLVALRNKTVFRSGPSHSSSTQDSSNRAQSLAQPFSKHAPYVLVAYLRALTSPLSFISPAVRNELEPGLFALCEMMGEYGRDLIMAQALDDSGKAMMRLIWQEYEKGRYVGKG